MHNCLKKTQINWLNIARMLFLGAIADDKNDFFYRQARLLYINKFRYRKFDWLQWLFLVSSEVAQWEIQFTNRPSPKGT